MLLIMMLWTPCAIAWGGAGHRVTGYIAASLLSESAQRQVRTLLGDEPLAAAAVYMDLQRESLSERWPESTRWHYDNQPACGRVPDYCADGNCATRQIERWRNVLGNPQASRADRAMALRLLVHMLGDIHQPLHMADNADHGGNNIQVRLYSGGERYRLHEVMDSILINQFMGEQRPAAYAQALVQRYQAQLASWRQGDVKDWAEQTHQLAVARVYDALPGFACGITREQTITLPVQYVEDARRYLPEQLAKAGVRIAALLNATFK